MFLLILESIGMQELILIGAIALIVLGPRKLPQMARTIGKMMTEFRKATSDFKETWEREVDFEDFKEEKQVKPLASAENTIAKNTQIAENPISIPEIKEIKQEDFQNSYKPIEAENKAPEETAKAASGKQDWL